MSDYKQPEPTVNDYTFVTIVVVLVAVLAAFITGYFMAYKNATQAVYTEAIRAGAGEWSTDIDKRFIFHNYEHAKHCGEGEAAKKLLWHMSMAHMLEDEISYSSWITAMKEVAHFPDLKYWEVRKVLKDSENAKEKAEQHHE